jgi:hypothetical protein
MAGKSKHWDARGRECFGGLDLKGIFRDGESRRLLNNFMLHRLLIHPFVEIRLRVADPREGHITWYGVGCDRSLHIEFNVRQVEAFRRLWRQKGRGKWACEELGGFVTFRLAGRVTLDGLARWTGR